MRMSCQTIISSITTTSKTIQGLKNQPKFWSLMLTIKTTQWPTLSSTPTQRSLENTQSKESRRRKFQTLLLTSWRWIAWLASNNFTISLTCVWTNRWSGLEWGVQKKIFTLCSRDLKSTTNGERLWSRALTRRLTKTLSCSRSRMNKTTKRFESTKPSTSK